MELDAHFTGPIHFQKTGRYIAIVGHVGIGIVGHHGDVVFLSKGD